MSYAYRACSTLTTGSTRSFVRGSRNTIFSTTTPRSGGIGSLRQIHSYGVRSTTTPARTGTLPALRSISRQAYSQAAALKARKLEDETAQQTNQRDLDEHEKDVKQAIAETTKQQIRRPWQREGADEPPVSKHRTEMNRNMAKGKLLTTPTRLLKLILPLPVDALHDEHGNLGESRSLGQNQDIQPLALLIHPQQPLSYLERLIQAELPPIADKDGREKMPNVYFLAEGSMKDFSEENSRNNGKGHKKGHHPKKADDIDNTNNPPDQTQNVASYSGLGREAKLGSEAESEAEKKKSWVRWSSSTEIGDFIRDAARGREFAVNVDGQSEMRVSVPSFNDRTHYMRVRLRRLSRRIEEQSKIKQECDRLAHKGAHRLAQAGFGAMTAWWGTVYYLTFHTDLGWDYMEPVTYLAGLATIMGGYLWFLFISRELSYQAALKITVSRRQAALYQARGFDANVWEGLVQDANDLRREVRKVAEEYDIEYDEAKDLGSEEMVEVLEKEEKKQRKKTQEEEDDDEMAEEEEKKEQKEQKEKKD